MLLYPPKGATPGLVRAHIARVQRALHGISGISLGTQDREAANFAAGLLEPTLLPLHVAGNEDTAQGIAETLRARLGLNGPTDHRLEMHLLGEWRFVGRARGHIQARPVARRAHWFPRSF